MSMDSRLQECGSQGEKGFSLLEVMVACAIAAILCAAVLAVQLNADNSNRYLYNRTIAYRAAHQVMEILLADDMDLMLLQDGNTFVVNEMLGGPQNGTITMTDLGWNGADKAWRVRLTIALPGSRNESITLEAVRTRV